MNAALLSDTALKARIDTPDFLEAITADSDGSFSSDVTSYLQAWKTRIKECQDGGLSKDEFEGLSKLTHSILTAERVLTFFTSLKKLSPAQAGGN